MSIDANTANTLAHKMLDAGAGFYSPEGKAILDGIGYEDRQLVARALFTIERRSALDALETTDAIRAEITRMIDQDVRGTRKPEHRDLSFFKDAAKTTRNQYGKARAPYAPKGTCRFKMDLTQAVHVAYSQEPYSDDSTYLVPVTGSLDGITKDEIAQANSNLTAFVRYADTHTGFAGSGVNWGATLIINEKGAFVNIHCRASIGD